MRLNFLKRLLPVVLLSTPLMAGAQLKTDWFNNDFSTESTIGAEVNAAYILLEGKTLQPVIVAVIDDGVDISHPDFAGRIWTNEGEIPDNGVDDDGNGYVDDVNGWNYLGNPDGENVKGETMEITRLYRKYAERFEGVDAAQLSGNERAEYEKYLTYKTAYEEEAEEVKNEFAEFSQIVGMYAGAEAFMREKLGRDTLTIEMLTEYEPADEEEAQVRDLLVYFKTQGVSDYLERAEEYFDSRLNHHFNLEFDPRGIVNEKEAAEKGIAYGNHMVWAEDPGHGTHVAGIIGAVRDNGIGVNGVASNAIIMPIRAVPDGDEYDQDIANGIRYAVDNGAKVINMSFGKSFSPDNHLVEDAIRYAGDHDVLVVHAAGNDASNNDVHQNYPDGTLGKKKTAKHVITVAAAGTYADSTVLASFSNYGRKSVDIMAPGVDILSLVPEGEVNSFSGTSMAAPVVSGVATLLRGLRPEWSAKKVKKVILKSGNDLKNLKVRVGGEKVALKKVLANPRMVSAANAVEKAL